jgi:hypothetical protein
VTFAKFSHDAFLSDGDCSSAARTRSKFSGIRTFVLRPVDLQFWTLPVALQSLTHLKIVSLWHSWRSSLLNRSSRCVSLMEPVRMNASTAETHIWTGQRSMANYANWLRAFQP